MSKDAFYFPHDYNARNDVKCLFLRQQLGMEGYGIFWFLIESLADSGGRLPMKIIPVLAMQMQVPDIKVASVINSFELFEIDESGFFSKRLNSHLEMRKILSAKGKQGADLRWKNSHPIALPNSPPIREGNAKERKGKERKERKDIQGVVIEIVNYLNEKTGKNFKPETTTTCKHINARMKEYTVEQAKQVIDFKVREWGNDEKMKNYLTPDTLFSESNFEKYVNNLNTNRLYRVPSIPRAENEY